MQTMRQALFFISLLCVFLVDAQTDLLLTDFQNGIPSNFTVVDNDGLTPDASMSAYTSPWITIQDPDNSLDTVASSTSFFSPAGTADRWLITPALTLGNYGNFIQWEAKSQDASYADDYLVLVSTTNTDLSSFTDTIGYVIQENPDWTVRNVDLSAEGYNNQTIYVAYRLITTDGFKLYVDDIHVWKNDPAELNELQTGPKITCYPNPTSDFLNVKCSESIEYMELYDLNGKLLKVNSSSIFHVEDLEKGTYFIRVFTQLKSQTIKFVKN